MQSLRRACPAALALATSAVVATLVTPSATAAPAFGSLLSANTTGQADTLVLGAPNGSYIGLGRGDVTYDFGANVILNQAGTVDLNVYEYDSSEAEFAKMDVLASQDGVVFFSLKSSEAALSRIAGDSGHHASYARSYDLGGLAWARYLRVDGTVDLNPGRFNGFDLDGVGAHHTGAIPVPEPATAGMLGAGLGLLALWRRRRAG